MGPPAGPSQHLEQRFSNVPETLASLSSFCGNRHQEQPGLCATTRFPSQSCTTHRALPKKSFFPPSCCRELRQYPALPSSRRSCWMGSSTALPHPNKLGLTHHLLMSGPCCFQGLSSSCPQPQAAPSSRRGRSHSADLWQTKPPLSSIFCI